MATFGSSYAFPFSDAEMPVRFGRYMLLKRRDADPIGETFLAAYGVEDGLDQLRLVRAIYPEATLESEFVALFSDEARALARLSSANVVRVMEVDTESGIPYVATEYVEGVTLDRLIEIGKALGGKCAWELAAYIAAELLRGLEYVHHREDILGKPMGMRHGDVRPANVIISFDGEVKLTNFGSGLHLISDEQMNARLEKARLGYTAPEQKIMEEASVVGDLWGVSAILATLLGTVLDEGDRKDVAGGGVPSLLVDFLDRALNVADTARFLDAAAMRESLLEIIRSRGSGHPQDDLAQWVAELGFQDRQEDETFIREMISKDALWTMGQPEDETALRPGVILDGRYRLLSLMGEGGMGQVFEAEHMGIGRHMAVKVLHERVLDDQVAVERFRREARITGALGHPNIVDVSDFGVTAEGHHYLAMGLLQGESLGDQIKGGRVLPLELAGIMARVCDGLEAAHRAGVIHRDLKPENIFLTDTGPKIVDFGIARRTGLEQRDQSLTRDGYICGTAEYLAPEQVRGLEHDHRADIYAAGVIIYEGLTGQTPYVGETVGDTLQRVMTAKLVPPRKVNGDRRIPKALEKICIKAVSRDPDKRFNSAAEMAQALREMLFADRSDQVSDHSSQLTQTTSPRVKHLTILVIALSAILASALVIFSIRLWRADAVPVAPASRAEVARPEKVIPKPEASAKASTEQLPTDSAPKAEPSPAALEKGPDLSIKPGQMPAPVKRAPPATSDAVKALVQQGNEALQKMALDDASAAFERARQLDQRVADAWYGLGRVAAQQDRYKDGIALVQRALRLSPGQARWRIYLGQLFMADGARDKAVEQWRRVLKADPENEQARKALKRAGVL